MSRPVAGAARATGSAAPPPAAPAPDRTLRRILRRVGGCTACPTIRGYAKFPPNASGRGDARFMLIGEAPGRQSLENGRQWTGTGGLILRREARRLGLDLEDLFYLTNVVKCWPAAAGPHPANRSPRPAEVARCGRFLGEEIRALDPEVVVAVGAVAARLVTGGPVRLPEDHGRRLVVDGREVVVLLHPANASRHPRVWPGYRDSLLALLAELAARGGFPVVEVTAAVTARDGRYLVTQRAPGRHLGGLWEFPGGKRRPGEGLEACLARELHEELGITAEVGERLAVVPWAYAEQRVVLHFFQCRIGEQRIEAREGQPVRWVTPGGLVRLSMPPADAEVVGRLARDGAGKERQNREEP